jgi:hypothetical protein
MVAAKPGKLPVYSSGIIIKDKALEDYTFSERAKLLENKDNYMLVYYIQQMAEAMTRIKEIYRTKRGR